MNKKLMVVAIAGVFAAPAAALAQTSTIQIYGTMNVEYGLYKGDKSSGVAYHSTDAVKSGASNIGFKGVEKLGGGLSAYFQCETSVEFLNGSGGSGSWCDRNSALGLSGGFGKVYYGTWDSPLKQAVGMTRLLGDTGPLGVTHTLLSIGRKNTGVSATLTTIATTGTTIILSTANEPKATFSDRPGNSFNYDSPVFNGFQLNLQTTAKNGALKTIASAQGVEGRANSMNLLYSGGPIKAAIAHTVRDDNKAAGGGNGDKDEATTFGLAYALGKAVIGFTHADMESKGGTQTLKRKVWNLAATYDLPGPHSVWAGYTKAGKITSNGVEDNSGSKEYQLGYKYTMSKRTFAAVGYARVSNDSAGKDSVGGHLEPSAGGQSSSAVSFQVQHKF